MKSFRLWGMAALFVALVGGTLWAVWNFDLRWRPHTIAKDEAKVARLLEQAGWVSPGLTGPKLYMVSFRSCPDCLRFKQEQFPDLHAAGVDTRVIEIARRDVNGVAKSTPTERSTVAELWVNRSWRLAQDWDETPIEAWEASGIPPADGDAARSAVVEAGRDLVDELSPLMKKNGVAFAYPLLVWWTQDGKMRACACERRETYKHVRKELGLDG
ncbi:MAG: hypothetical protein ACK4YQ_02945 [Phenylobacterium sp.]|uniref:hypothetical protein n=1 Tax=Phenylobacterium sp. TaxID=1871053 RepID=UPI00391BCB25